MLLSLADVIAGLAADAPAPPTPVSSPTAELITVTLAGVAAIITAVGGYARLRGRRQAEADAPVAVLSDPEDRSSRIRERLTALETRATNHDRELADLKELLALRRAVDIAYESEQAPRRRRPTKGNA